jgi:acetyl-CoA carboxylase biotin carboxyl carrier protein
MDLQKIKALIDLVSDSSLNELELIEGDHRLRITKDGAPQGRAHSAPAEEPPAPKAGAATTTPPPAAAPSVPPPVQGTTFDAPMFGVFSASSAPGEPPYVQIGDTVAIGQTLCAIEAMKVFNIVESDRAGRVAAVLVQSGQEVQAGQPLFRIE